MTTASSFDHQAMDFTSLEDKMDVASTPFSHLEDVEDLDFEFDQMDNRPPDLSTDNVMDDATEPSHEDGEIAVEADLDFFGDEKKREADGRGASNELAMNEVSEETQGFDEDVLYEEEEDSTVIVNMPDDENHKYLQDPEKDTEDLDEPDETDNSGPTKDSTGQETVTEHPTDTDLGEAQINNDLRPPQDTSNTLLGEDSTTRDDGDGPTVNPIATEYFEDPDDDWPVQPAESELQVEESYAEALNEEEAISMSPEDRNEDVSAPPASVETVQQDKTVEGHIDTRVLQDDLHSVRVVYQGVEYSLFPPTGDDSTSYFLEDPSLATQPLDILLKSCREVVGKPEDLDHHDELILDVPTMGLHICEDSRYVSQIRLADVVEVYLSLNRNEGRKGIEPLYCSLSTRVCLSTQFNWLRDQAKEGFTFSHIAAQHVDTPIEENEDPDSRPSQEYVGEQPDNAKETSSEKEAGMQPVSADASYPPDDQGLQSESQESSGDLRVAPGSAEEVAGTDGHYLAEDPEPEPGVLPLEEEGQETVSDPTTAPDPEAADKLLGTEADTVAPEPDADAEVSEFFREAIDEPIEDEEEEIRGEAEDASALQEALAEEQVEAQSLLAGEEDRDNTFDNQNEYDAEEFLINPNDKSASEAETRPNHGAAVEAQDIFPATTNGSHANGDQLAIKGTDSSAVPPTTPSKKNSKRKVSNEEDDYVLDLDTPEPKRRRPS